MFKNSLAGTLLSLFTTTEQAESIEGDLIEERSTRGIFWFWLQLIRITFTLFQQSLVQAPFQTLTLSSMAFGILVCAVWVTTNVLQLIDSNYAIDPFFMFVVAVIITCLPSFFMGIFLVWSAPVIGIRAVAVTTILIFFTVVVIQLGSGASILQQELDIGFGAVVALLGIAILIILAALVTALQAITPIIIGAFVARRRFLLRETDSGKSGYQR